MSNTNKGTGKKEYKPSVGFWPSKSGNGYSVVITQQVLDALKNAKLDGTMHLGEVPEDVRAENEKIPAFRVTIFEPREKTTPADERI